MYLIQKIEIARKKIDAILDELVCEVAQGEQVAQLRADVELRAESYENIYPFAMDGAIFKGTKPTRLLFGETDQIDVRSWKMVFCEILEHCNDDPEKHVALMNLRGKVSGRDRVLLSKSSEGMRSPHKIANNLYVETHYDTETLHHILTKRILDPIGYDYSHIQVTVRKRP